MTVHSLAEGVGIGVSFGDSSVQALGQFISLALAIHNVPEGLAVCNSHYGLVCLSCSQVCLIMLPKGFSRRESALWAVFSSLPQPIMACLAYTCVSFFVQLLPIGLGFAAGAMALVAVQELMYEAIEEIGKGKTVGIMLFACAVMTCFQVFIH